MMAIGSLDKDRPGHMPRCNSSGVEKLTETCKQDKETREQMLERHRKELEEFRKNCKHETVSITDSIDGMESPIKTHEVIVFSNNYTRGRGLVIHCIECGKPLFSMTQGKVDFAEGFVKKE